MWIKVVQKFLLEIILVTNLHTNNVKPKATFGIQIMYLTFKFLLGYSSSKKTIFAPVSEFFIKDSPQAGYLLENVSPL